MAGAPCVLGIMKLGRLTYSMVKNKCILDINVSVKQIHTSTSLLFSSFYLDRNQQQDGFTCQRFLWEGQGLWEVWRRKDNKSLTVVLYFFLLRDAPSSPSVLIGSGEHQCADRADVNGAWRTSAAGTNIPTSLLPFSYPSFPSFRSTWYNSITLNIFLWFSPFFFPSFWS